MANAQLSLATDLLKQLGSIAVQLARQEIKLIVGNLIAGVDKEIEKLSESFKIIQMMLNAADERQWTEAAVKLWLDQLRDVYYMMDDVLDKWNTARIKSEIQKEEEERVVSNNNPAALKKRKVLCSFFLSLSCCFHQVDNLSLRHEIRHKIENLKQTLDNIYRDKETYGFHLTTHSHVEVERPTTTSFVDVSDIIGRDNYRDELLSNLLGVGGQEEGNPCVISLVGMGGIGKSTLAQLAYNHHDIQAHFQQRIWICVSDPFDQCKVAKAIIECIEGQSPNITELQDLLNSICDLIRGNTFLLVLDDVWTKEFTKWEPFKNALKCGAQGSKILVTTRKYSVAKMMESSCTINLGVLSPDDCWLMFSKIAFSFIDEQQRRDVEALGRQLANKCKGLPLAAKTLGSFMRFKRSSEEWEGVLQSSLCEIEDIEKGLIAPLLLSYYDLPFPLKQCFSYCAVFPKDYLFFRDELVVQWIAQGYIESKPDMTMEIIAEKYFENLVIHSFFQDFMKDDDGKIICCKMHDIMHDIAQLMTKNESFQINGDNNLGIDCKSARHLLLDIYYTRDYVFNMLLFDSFHNFRCLRTLILNYPFEKLPDAIGNLIHLRCLHLSAVVRISEFPETLCNLHNLRTLSIEDGCYLKKLPQGLGKLINLRHLRFSRDYYAERVASPKGIGKLTRLRTLSDFNIGGKDDRKGCKLGELKKLNDLQGTLGIHGLRNVEDVGEAQYAQLKKKTCLRGLVLKFGKFVEGIEVEEEDRTTRRMENDVLVLFALEPPPNLEILKIGEYMGSVFPNWMMSLTNLKELVLSECWKLECLPDYLRTTPLQKLHIKDCPILQQRCKRGIGDDWHKISHIPNIKIDGKYVRRCGQLPAQFDSEKDDDQDNQSRQQINDKDDVVEVDKIEDSNHEEEGAGFEADEQVVEVNIDEGNL